MVHLIPLFAYLLVTTAYGRKCASLLLKKEIKALTWELFFLTCYALLSLHVLLDLASPS